MIPLHRAAAVFAVLIVAASCANTAEPAKPNIIIILCDDIGFSDLGCYGGEMSTPNVDQLAADGVRFTQFYNTARCCPTRACLLTGLYPHQAGMGHMTDDSGFEAYRGDLNSHCVTIAQVMKPAGYRCYAVGKWHVTRFIDAEGPKHNWPLQRGFDRYYGTIVGAGSYFDPSALVNDNTMISAYADPDYKPAKFYYTDAITDHAIRFVGDHVKDQANKPFFMYVAYTAAHWPMHALPEDIARHKGQYDGGYEPIRKARFEKEIQLGLVDPKQPLSPQAQQWDNVADKRWEAACMEVYAAMIDRMDQGVGKIVAELKRTGQLNNTLILFLQDNGACAEPMGRIGRKDHPNIVRPDKPTFPPMKPEEFAARGSVPAQTRDGYPVRMGPKVMPGANDTYVAYGRGWANVSNTPFREYKHWVHEGGISTPLIAHWPAGISKQRNGQLFKEPGHLIDLMATCADLGGAKYPEKLADNDIQPMQGVTLRPAFEGKTLDRKHPLYWEHEGNKAIRDGKWKLVSKDGKNWELHDMETDRVEGTDIASANPELVKKLSEQWDTWAKRVGVQPYPLRKTK